MRSRMHWGDDSWVYLYMNCVIANRTIIRRQSFLKMLRFLLSITQDPPTKQWRTAIRTVLGWLSSTYFGMCDKALLYSVPNHSWTSARQSHDRGWMGLYSKSLCNMGQCSAWCSSVVDWHSQAATFYISKLTMAWTGIRWCQLYVEQELLSILSRDCLIFTTKVLFREQEVDRQQAAREFTMLCLVRSEIYFHAICLHWRSFFRDERVNDEFGQILSEMMLSRWT